MEWKPKDACGVVGISTDDREVSGDIYLGLRALQHRGQESAGIATFGARPACITGMGLVHEVFDRDNLQTLVGRCGIGHIRYSTSGGSNRENAQPVRVETTLGELALGHNGDITNADSIRAQLQASGWAFYTTTDSEVMLRLIANEVADHRDLPRAVRAVCRMLHGSYALVVLLNDSVVGVRDPHGIKPLSLGRYPNDGGYVLASESVAFDTLGAEFVRDIAPGEIVVLRKGTIHSVSMGAAQHKAHCMFEWVYFARPDSVLEGSLVQNVRVLIGRALAEQFPVAGADMVVPVPDSGRDHAAGFSAVSGLPMREALIKNRYIHRTFIMPDQRAAGVHLKLNAIRSVVAGKNIVLVDDSIVRGTTMRRIVTLLRERGATQVHVRVGSPPIIAPCYLGIDMKDSKEFVARGRTTEEVAEEIGADSVAYLPIEQLVKSIGKQRTDLCLGCLTGEYPVPIPGERVRFQTTLDLGVEGSAQGTGL